jgi:pteridine reductase
MHNATKFVNSANEIYSDGMSQPQRAILVTGGAVRVGRGIVEKFFAMGWQVAFTYWKSEEQAAEIAQKCKAIALRANLFEPETAAGEIVQSISSRIGRLDALVNNASDFLNATLQQTSIAQIRQLNAVHFESPFLLCQKLSPLLRASRGHVVNMLDLLVERPWPAYLAYCASKAALANFTLGLARELAPEVTVNGIAPGAVEWPKTMPAAERERYLQRVPLARAGTPQDLADLVYFLCTEGSYITGQIIRLDGGRSIT